jgi:SAM-dependent methyltransferase
MGSSKMGVNMKVDLKEIFCAVCESKDHRVKYPEHINYGNIDFSPRRTSSRNHCRIVQCKNCGLVYANPIFNDHYILQLYRNSSFINEKQVELMAEDYLDQLKVAAPFIDKKCNLLEIGCGNGCFLKKAKEFGFKNVFGVEPCKDSVEQADQEIKGNIINDVFKGGLYKDNFFDLACIIHVLDHAIEPNDVLENVYRTTKESGHVLVICHNIKFMLGRILGESSPMYDIEHIYLFDKTTVRKMLEKNGFKVIYVKDMISRYTIRHVVKMFPFPDFIRTVLLKAVNFFKMGDKTVRIYGGSMVAFAQKVG